MRHDLALGDGFAVDENVEQFVGQPVKLDNRILTEREHVFQFDLAAAELDREADIDIAQQIQSGFGHECTFFLNWSGVTDDLQRDPVVLRTDGAMRHGDAANLQRHLPGDRQWDDIARRQRGYPGQRQVHFGQHGSGWQRQIAEWFRKRIGSAADSQLVRSCPAGRIDQPVRVGQRGGQYQRPWLSLFLLHDQLEMQAFGLAAKGIEPPEILAPAVDRGLR